MPRGARHKIEAIHPDVLEPYLAGTIGYREVARRLGKPRNTVLRTLARLGYVGSRSEIDMQGAASRERWVPVPREVYRDDYQVSDRGRIRRSSIGHSTRPGKVLRPAPIGRYRHPVLTLSAGGRTRTFPLVSLVADAFLPPRPGPGYVLGHRNGRNDDCRAINLYWKVAANRGSRKFGKDDLARIRAMKGVRTAVSVAAEYGVSRPTISCIWSGKTYRDDTSSS